MRGNLLATVTLAIIVLLSVVLATLTIVVPSLPSLLQVPPRLAGLGTAYFLLIGLAFMFVEIGLFHRISIYLRHPVMAWPLIVWDHHISRIGSLLASRLRWRAARASAVGAILGVYLILRSGSRCSP
jgi:hypothetical protein